ncbi:hypothetical protein HPP92_027676 [Vanilla planifolia]|uniref:Uncharacterized protein n=1 Tax=Vanilla planifolia TaxID=51239 RepID=A0A835P916_VANPL|nr:hypothetical protein HPP92_027676 [Vanilla planifolia]
MAFVQSDRKQWTELLFKQEGLGGRELKNSRSSVGMLRDFSLQRPADKNSRDADIEDIALERKLYPGDSYGRGVEEFRWKAMKCVKMGRNTNHEALCSRMRPERLKLGEQMGLETPMSYVPTSLKARST